MLKAFVSNCRHISDLSCFVFFDKLHYDRSLGMTNDICSDNTIIWTTSVVKIPGSPGRIRPWLAVERHSRINKCHSCWRTKGFNEPRGSSSPLAAQLSGSVTEMWNDTRSIWGWWHWRSPSLYSFAEMRLGEWVVVGTLRKERGWLKA